MAAGALATSRATLMSRQLPVAGLARVWRRDPDLRDRVLGCLQNGWSPEQIAGRFALDAGTPVISHETIYRFIYAQIARTQDYSWRLYLPRAKANAASAAGEAAARQALSRAVFQSPSGPGRRQIDATPVTGRPISSSSPNTARHILALHERNQSRILATGRPTSTLSQSPSVRLPSSVPPPTAPDRHLRQWHRVRPPLRTA